MSVDLDIGNFEIRSTYVSVSVDNDGTSTSLPTTVGTYLSQDATVTASDTLIGSTEVGRTGAPSGFFYDMDTAFPDAIAKGHYFMAAIVDPTNFNHDTNLANNVTSSVAVTLGGSGNDTLTAAAGNQAIFGRGGDDVISDAHGGVDTISGGDGDDTIDMHGSLTSFDWIDGGAGNDRLVLSGFYFNTQPVLLSNGIQGIEHVTVGNGFSYNLLFNGDFLNQGGLYTVSAAALTAGHVLHFNAIQEAYNPLDIIGGAGNDMITGGADGNVFYGGLGADTLTAGGPHDIFRYHAADESTSSGFDTINGFNTPFDKFKLPVTVAAIDTEISGGTLNAATFDTDLATAIGAKALHAHDAVLFAPNSGDESTFQPLYLIIDANGVAGYQAGEDYVIKLTTLAHPEDFSTHNFTH